MPATRLPNRVYLGVALVAMSTLMLELILTRIFSLTLWYHFAFMSISLALFGMSASGIYVYLVSPARSEAQTLRRLAIAATLFSLTTVLALIAQLQTRFVPSFSLTSILLLGQVYLVVAIPFFFGGLCISLVLTQFAGNVSRLYFFDLVGAGIGCFLVLPTLTVLTGPGGVVVAAAVAAASAWCFASAAGWRGMSRATVLLGVGLVVLMLVDVRSPLFKFTFIKGAPETDILVEKWNPFSRVVLQGSQGNAFVGWSPSAAYEGPTPHAMLISIDAHAGTPLYKFDGDLPSMQALKYDATGIAYYLKHSGSSLVIGSGGGKDILTGLLFGMNPVIGVEMNPSVVEIAREDFGDYGGHLYDRDDVELVVDEGRSYIARSKLKYDIIQASLVDSWAATAAGAYVLTENHLYTIEAYQEYFKHLTDDGILTMSRIFGPYGGQSLRLTALGYEAWAACGVPDPQAHLMLVRHGHIGTLLMKKSPFTPEEYVTIRDTCERLGFELVASPRGSSHPVLQQLFDMHASDSFYAQQQYNLRPPVDDKPFFFHMLRIRDFLSRDLREATQSISVNSVVGLGGLAYNDNAIMILGALLVIVTTLALLFIVGPLWTFRRAALRSSPGKWGFLLYFSCLGVGFMMVEVPLMQKLMLFLGHPLYTLAVTLFALLISSGVGSYLSGFVPASTPRRWLQLILIAVVVLILAYIKFVPWFTYGCMALQPAPKVCITVAAIIPLGLLLGMPFPLGVKLVDRQAHAMIPWVWGINGAMSVLASVWSIAVAISFGFSTALAIGAATYGIACLAVRLGSEPAEA